MPTRAAERIAASIRSSLFGRRRCATSYPAPKNPIQLERRIIRA
jgi:hypothetical protein